MFHNYFFLKRLSAALDKSISGYTVLECFSQNKDELIIGLGSREEELFIRANLHPGVSLLEFPETFKRARKNSVDLFPEILDRKILSVEVLENERSFQVNLQDAVSLIFKMHGSRSNVLLITGQQVLKVFRNQMSQDLQIIPHQLNQPLKLDPDRFKEVNGDASAFLPALGKEVRLYLHNRHYEEQDLTGKWKLLTSVLDQLEKNPVFIYESDQGPTLSLLELNQTPILETQHPVHAANEYYRKFASFFYLSKEKQAALKELDDKIRKTRNYIKKTTGKLEEVKSYRSYEEIANLIMANLHQLATSQKQATLFDFYLNKDIVIKLNSNLTPQKNAENYYRKAKNQKIELRQLAANIDSKKQELEKLTAERSTIAALEDHRQLRKHKGSPKKKVQPEKTALYHAYQFDGYEILIGKNAKANDDLTLKHANKDDIWLHARDVAGSHVIIRNQAGKSIPSHVLERSAEIAAWYSKRKNDTLCPVIFTPKKFVRKRKGDPPGRVVVDREEVIMVAPKGF